MALRGWLAVNLVSMRAVSVSLMLMFLSAFGLVVNVNAGQYDPRTATVAKKNYARAIAAQQSQNSRDKIKRGVGHALKTLEQESPQLFARKEAEVRLIFQRWSDQSTDLLEQTMIEQLILHYSQNELERWANLANLTTSRHIPERSTAALSERRSAFDAAFAKIAHHMLTKVLPALRKLGFEKQTLSKIR